MKDNNNKEFKMKVAKQSYLINVMKIFQIRLYRINGYDK